MTTENKTAIKPEITDLEKKISEAMKMDIKDNVGICTVEDGLYVKMLPEGITEDHVRTIQKYNSQLAAASLLAVGNVAVPAMREHSNLNKVSLEFPTVDKDHIDVNFDRSRQVPSRDENNVPNGTKTKYGSAQVSYSMYGTSSHGQLLAVKKMLAEQAMEAFGK
jgi:hypothetical protein